MYVGPEAFFAQRTFVRTLTTYGAGDDEKQLLGDLATDTGKESNGGKSWTFTLRDGVKWEDGSPVTCEDVRHGVARTFDRTTHIAGTNYASFLLDVPTKVTSEGLEKPVYTGPADKKNAKSFLKAVVCKDRQITFNLRAPSETSRTSSPPCPSLRRGRRPPTPRRPRPRSPSSRPGHTGSTAPGILAGAAPSSATSTGSPGPTLVRKAYPDRIVLTTGLTEATVIERLLNQQGSDAQAVSWVKASPTLRNQAGTALRAWMTFPHTGSVDYLALNMRSPVMSKDVVREAFALATNRATYVTANGGDGAGVLDVVRPRAGVSEAGLTPPRRRWVEGDLRRGARPPREGWPQAPPQGARGARRVAAHRQGLCGPRGRLGARGFDVERTAVPPEEYYKTIEKPSAGKDYDVFRGSWLPDIPSASAVLPALFDARINIDSSGPGQDVGYFEDSRPSSWTRHKARSIRASARRPGPRRTPSSANEAATSRSRRRRCCTSRLRRAALRRPRRRRHRRRRHRRAPLMARPRPTRRGKPTRGSSR